MTCFNKGRQKMEPQRAQYKRRARARTELPSIAQSSIILGSSELKTKVIPIEGRKSGLKGEMKGKEDLRFQSCAHFILT